MSKINKSEKIKVSIIVAIYNSEKFLSKLLPSIVNQTYNNIEVFLIDDGSSDKSAEICDCYAAKDSRIHVVHKQNEGTCKTRNVGLKLISGDYFMIVDGDDWLEEDCVEYLLNIALSTDSQMAMSANVFTTRDRIQIENDKIEVWSCEKAIAQLLYPYIVGGPWNKIYNTKLIKDHKIVFSEPWFGEGLYFATRAAQAANQVGVGNKKVYNYRLNNINSGLTTYNVKHGLDALINVNNIKNSLCIKSEKIDNAIEWHFCKTYGFLLLQIIGSNSKKKYKNEYDNCISELKKRCFQVCNNAEVGTKEKIKVIFCGIMPVLYTKIAVWKRRIALQKDIKNIE